MTEKKDIAWEHWRCAQYVDSGKNPELHKSEA